jgi:hypothetical protein
LKSVAARFQSKALGAGATLAEGRVRLAEGEFSDAQRLLSDAARAWTEVGAPYETALARFGLAEALRAGGKEDQAGLEYAAAHAILQGAKAVPTAPKENHDGQRPAAEPNIFRREGDYWLVVFDRRTVRVRDLKGMRYLARLLAAPGREFHVLDLANLEARSDARFGSGSAEGLSPATLGDAGWMLDETAKNAYRRRLVEIDDDIEQARALGDEERAAQADAERDFLVRELSRAVGLGGRDRRAAAASERARVAVTRAVRQAMARIDEHHPELGEHLNRAIRTGTYCAYDPDRRAVAWMV